MLKATLFTLSSALLLTAAAVSAVAVQAAGKHAAAKAHPIDKVKS